MRAWLAESTAGSSADHSAAMLARLGNLDVVELERRLCDEGYAVVDGALGQGAVRAVHDEIARLDRRGRLRIGRVLHGAELSTNSEVRSDRIAFLSAGGATPSGASGASSSSGPPAVEAEGPLSAYLLGAEALRGRLGDAARLIERVGGGLDGCTAMCAVYPGGGSRYAKHRDALAYRAGRKLTVILYLNSGWESAHGGELRLWPAPTQEGAEREPVTVSPLADRLLLFVSSLEHEVLPAWKPRSVLPRTLPLPQQPSHSTSLRRAHATLHSSASSRHG